MNKKVYVAAIFAIAVLVGANSCGSDKKGEENSADTEQAAADSLVSATPAKAESSLDIRYIDEEKLQEEYNLAKDVKESLTRLEAKLMSAGQSRQNDIQQLASQIESKLKSGGYSNEADYQADMAKLQKKQQEAESYLANMQRTTQNEAVQLNNQLTDSIMNFVKDFSERNKFDAVLSKSAGFYYNPDLDVTEAVVKGLNARYNKVAK